MEKKLLAKIARSQDCKHALKRKLDQLDNHNFDSDETQATSELILTQLINIAEMKHKYAAEIFAFILKAIYRLPAGSPILNKIVNKATSAHISQTDEFPFHLVDYALHTADGKTSTDILVKAAETNDDLFAYVFTGLSDAGDSIENAKELVGILFARLPLDKILKSLPRVQHFVPQLSSD